MEKSGCRFAVSIGLALMFILGFLMMRGGPPPEQSREAASNAPAVAKIGDYRVTEASVEAMTQQPGAQQLPPQFMARMLGGAVEQAVNAGLLIQLANRLNIKLDDEAIMRALESQVDEQLQRERTQMIAQGKLKPDATEEQFVEEIKKQYGGTPAEVRQRYLEGARQRLSSPDGRNEIARMAANSLITDELKRRHNLSDEELKKSFSTYVSKRVFLNASKHPGVDLKERAQKILGEIKGGLSFEAAMEKYSDETPAKGKKVSENTFEVDVKTMTVNPDFGPLMALKPGEMTDVMMMGDGASIFKLISIRPDVPGDFEARKASIADEYLLALAASEMQKELKALKDSDLIKWESPGYHVLFDWNSFEMDPATASLTPAEKRKRYEELLARAKKAGEDDPLGPKAAAYAQFGIFEQIYNGASEGDKKGLIDGRIEAINAVLQVTEDVDLRLQLVDLNLEKKDKDAVALNLQQAVDVNAGTYDAGGERVFRDINARLSKVKAQQGAPPESVKRIETALAEWRAGHAEQKKYEAEEKKKQEEAERKAKEAEAEAKKPKAREEIEKQGGSAKPPTGSDSPAPATTGSTGATTGQ